MKLSKRTFKSKTTGKEITFGKTLADFLKLAIADAATAEAGEGGDAAAIEAAIHSECEAAVEDFAQVIAGTSDPDAEKCAAIASVLTNHGWTGSGDDLVKMASDTTEDAPTEDAAATEALRAQAAEAVTLRAAVGTHEAELVTLRSEVERMKPLAVLGEQSIATRRADLRRAFTLAKGGGKVAPALLARIESGSLADLEVLELSLPSDRLDVPHCAEGHPAVEYRSSVKAEAPVVRAPRVREPGVPPTGSEQRMAARAHLSRAKAMDPTTTMTEIDALRSVRGMTHAQQFSLADEAEQLAPAPTT